MLTTDVLAASQKVKKRPDQNPAFSVLNGGKAMPPYKDKAFKLENARNARPSNFNETALGIAEQERVERLQKMERLKKLRLQKPQQVVDEKN